MFQENRKLLLDNLPGLRRNKMSHCNTETHVNNPGYGALIDCNECNEKLCTLCEDEICCIYHKWYNAGYHLCTDCMSKAIKGELHIRPEYIIVRREDSTHYIICSECVPREYGDTWEERFKHIHGDVYMKRKFVED